MFRTQTYFLGKTSTAFQTWLGDTPTPTMPPSVFATSKRDVHLSTRETQSRATRRRTAGVGFEIPNTWKRNPERIAGESHHASTDGNQVVGYDIDEARNADMISHKKR